ncbi:WD repeat-containing protein on Y chromosome-like [Ptychodera flava]|uniref:WD repeat-containing protein on Y chromosome-like n=1 Tax=Ptychodera flava TaxID=63121 RepID=UPI003969F14E
MNNDHLQKLQSIFEEADEDGGGGLDIDEFRQAMKKTMGAGQVDDRQLAIVFMKVDANCDGTVDWDEYLSYMLLEYQERDLMNNLFKDVPFPKQLREISSNHRDMISSVKFLPTITHRHGSVADESDHSVGRYISVSKEGVVNFWTLDMNNLRSVTLEQPRDKVKPMWITDMVCMPNINMIAMSSTERDLCFYDVNGSKFDKVFQVSGMEHAALCMDYWYDVKNMNNAVLCFGDAGGNVCVFVFSEALGSALFGSQNAKGVGCRRVPFHEILKGSVKGIRALRYLFVHEDWVRKVQYCHNLHSVISCATTSENSMFIGDVERKKTGSVFKIRKGLQCFEYSKEWNVIVTGGMDRTVRLWNPYVTTKSTAVLKGHNSAIMHIALNGNNGQIISVAKEKQIKVWDMRDQTCLQTVAGRNVNMGPHLINTIFYNARNGSLILGTNMIAIFERKAEEGEVGEPMSHNKAVTHALYNNLFNQVVSASDDSIVSVWDLDTGTKTIQFTAHKTIERGVEKSVEITAMTFDPSKRRLFTGARDGTVKVWNFNNGACLRELEVFDNYEVTGIVCPRSKIVTTGWNRRLTMYIDLQDDDECRQWPIRHKDDILSLTSYGPSHLATSSYDGDIIIWSLETGHVLSRLNAMESVKPQTDRLNSPVTPVRPMGRDKSASTISEKDCKAENKESSSSVEPKTTDSVGIKRLLDETSVKESLKNASKETFKDKSRGTLPAINNQANMVTSETDKSDDSETKKSDISDSSVNRPKSGLQGNDFYHIHSKSYAEFQRKHEASVDKMIFLQAREQDKETATLLASGAEGWVRAWSIDHKGGLLGQFLATNRKNESVLAMTTDSQNQILITGDTMGYIMVWEIGDYCIKKGTGPQVDNSNLRKRFPYLKPDGLMTLRNQLLAQTKHQENLPKPPPQTNPEETIREPLKLNAYRAHLEVITFVEYAEEKELIITSSTDCSVRLWTLCGRYIGTFGQKGGWEKLPEIIVPERVPRRLPGDVKRVASAITLKVLNGGSRPRWKLARNILLLCAARKSLGQKTNLEGMFNKVGGELVGDSESSEDDEDKHVDQGISTILGKSYKPKTRHKVPPMLPEIRQNANQLSVFSSLPFCELEPVQEPKLPAVIQQIQARQQSMENLDKEGTTKQKLKRRAQEHLLKHKTVRILTRDNKEQRPGQD